MKGLVRRKLIFKAVLISSLVLGALGAVGTVVFSLLVLYIPLGISIALLANALYGSVFYYIGLSNAEACLRAMPVIFSGECKLSSVAAAMRRTEPAAQKLLLSAIRRGYLQGFLISDGEICRADGFEKTNENI